MFTSLKARIALKYNCENEILDMSALWPDGDLKFNHRGKLNGEMNFCARRSINLTV